MRLVGIERELLWTVKVSTSWKRSETFHGHYLQNQLTTSNPNSIFTTKQKWTNLAMNNTRFQFCQESTVHSMTCHFLFSIRFRFGISWHGKPSWAILSSPKFLGQQLGEGSCLQAKLIRDKEGIDTSQLVEICYLGAKKAISLHRNIVYPYEGGGQRSMEIGREV